MYGGYGLANGWGAAAYAPAAYGAWGPAPAAPAGPCGAAPCAEMPPVVENRQFQYQYPPLQRCCDQHYQQCSQQLRDNNNHIMHDRVILNNVNRHHHHINRILVRDNYIHHYNTRYVTRVNDIHHYRNEYIRAPGKNLADYRQTEQIERGVCRNAGVEQAVLDGPRALPAPAPVAVAAAAPVPALAYAPAAPAAIAYAPAAPASSCGCQ